MKGTLFVVDALNYVFRAFHALPGLTTKAGVPTGAVYGFCQMLLRIEREHKPSHLCVVFDAPGPTFRDEIFPEYKANRPPTPPELIAQIGLTREVAEAFGYAVLSVPGVEADDVIATLARDASREGLEVVIGSSDKDLMQLCNEDVRLLDAMKNRMMGPAEVKEKWGVPPDKLGDVLALMGDTVDNVPGVPGIGPKTAADLINSYGSLDQVLAQVDKIKGKKGQAIAEARDKLALSRTLVRLRDDVALPKSVAELRMEPASPEKLRELFSRLEFGRLLAQVQAPRGSDEKAAAEQSSEGEAGVAAPEAAASPTQPSTVNLEIITDRPGVERLAQALVEAKACGIAVLAEGNSAVRANLVGLAFALPAGEKTFYVPAKPRVLAATSGLSDDDIFAALAPVLADASIAKHIHDGKALDVMARVRGHALSGVVNDTMIAGYVLDAAGADYDLSTLANAAGLASVPPRSAWIPGKSSPMSTSVEVGEAARQMANEAGATLALASWQNAKLDASKQESLYRDIELALSPVLAAMECWGIRLDTGYLHNLGNEVATLARGLESEIHGLAGGAFNIASPKQLSDVLFGKLGLPILKKTKTGASTDADVLDQLAAMHPLPAKILDYRTLTKLRGTYIEALPALVNPRTGRLHTTFHQTVAATGRLSSSDPNLQNIPIRSDIGKKIRHAFVADPGFRMVSADYSQIELRVLAHFSQDPAFLEAFRAGADIHRRTAAEVFGVAEAEVSSEQRRIAKAINFGLVFGQTDFGLAQVLRIPRGEAHQYIESYFKRYARVREHMDAMIAEARRTQVVTTLLGRTRALPEIAAKRPQDRNYAERIARNSPIQGSAADILKLAMLRVARGLGEFPGVRMLLTVHDELVFEVPEADADAFCPWVKREMEAAYVLAVPLVVDVRGGRTWGDAHS